MGGGVCKAKGRKAGPQPAQGCSSHPARGDLQEPVMGARGFLAG